MHVVANAQAEQIQTAETPFFLLDIYVSLSK